MKHTTILITLITATIVFSCKPKPKTAQEIFQATMEGKTDDDLITEMYGHPQNYEITYSHVEPAYSNELHLQLNQGGIIQVMFNKDKVYIEGIGTLSGSYERGYYSNPTGELTISYTRATSFGGAVSAGLRRHPKENSHSLTITFTTPLKAVIATYSLERLP